MLPSLFRIPLTSEKCNFFEFDNHLLRRISILQAYFEPKVYIAVSKPEPGLGF